MTRPPEGVQPGVSPSAFLLPVTPVKTVRGFWGVGHLSQVVFSAASLSS